MNRRPAVSSTRKKRNWRYRSWKIDACRLTLVRRQNEACDKDTSKSPISEMAATTKIGKMAACKMALAVGRPAAITEALKKT